jgi:hypothetical protein
MHEYLDNGSCELGMTRKVKSKMKDDNNRRKWRAEPCLKREMKTQKKTSKQTEAAREERSDTKRIDDNRLGEKGRTRDNGL